jgi:hypothetical protein
MADADREIEKNKEHRGKYEFTNQEITRFLDEHWKLTRCDVCNEPDKWALLQPNFLSVIRSSDGKILSILPIRLKQGGLLCS